MSEEDRQAIQITVNILDNLMGESPNSALADCSNYLQTLLDT